MTKPEKAFNLAGVVVPFVGTVAAIVLLWDQFVSVRDLAILGAMYVVTALGVTVGYHRLLTHRSFATSKPLEYGFAALGSMALQGPVIAWVAEPPQAPRPRRPGGRSSQPPHQPRRGPCRGPARALPRPRRLALARVGPRRLEALRPGAP